jgi:predicted RNase H-like HicB family nuclease
MADRIFRCYTEKSPDGQYYAVCLDLNLIDKRETLDEAIAALDENILGYLASVQEHGDEATAIPRPVRRGEWLHFYQLSLRNVILTILGRRLDGFLAYTKKAPSAPASAIRLAYA